MFYLLHQETIVKIDCVIRKAVAKLKEKSDFSSELLTKQKRQVQDLP